MIKVYFQPIVDNTNGKITKYEALVRLIKDDGEVLSPYFFLDIAVKANLYAKITRIVINKSFEKFHNLPYILTINLSIEDINNKETLSFIFNKLKSYPNPENIVFEILESQEIKDYIAVKEFVKKVKKIGAKIAIDDFGSGYSNFEHIINIGADFIKIDGSLIKNIDCDKNSQILVESIINLSKNLGIKTIAEFVCSKDIYDIVQNMEADFSQGYYLGEPRSNLV
jgi:EAL domain-containing protein (putative c-di-GMP-specific phosphodiesterase class I)